MTPALAMLAAVGGLIIGYHVSALAGRYDCRETLDLARHATVLASDSVASTRECMAAAARTRAGLEHVWPVLGGVGGE